MLLRGRIEGFDGRVLRGWAWNSSQPYEPVVVRFVVAGRVLEKTIADRPRADLKKAGFGRGDHGIRFSTPSEIDLNDEIEVVLWGEDEAGQHVELDRRVLRAPQNMPAIFGRVERLEGDECVGWVYNSRDSSETLQVEALWGTKVVAQGAADTLRKDLAKAGYGKGRNGFRLTVPALMEDEAPSDRKLMIRVTDGEIVGSVEVPAPEAIAVLLKIAGRTTRFAGVSASAIAAAHPGKADFEKLWAHALDAAHEGDVDTARSLAATAYTVKPQNARAAQALARLSHDIGQHEDALNFWRLIPPDDHAYRERLIKSARALAALGRPIEALLLGRELTAADPADLEGHLVLANAYERIGAPTMAAPHLDAAVKAKPADKSLAARLAAALESSTTAEVIDATGLEFLENHTLSDWRLPVRGLIERPVWVSHGVRLGPSSASGVVSYRVGTPMSLNVGKSTAFGLILEGSDLPVDIRFQLKADFPQIFPNGMCFSIEAESRTDDVVGLDVHLILEDQSDGLDSRPLAGIEAGRRRRMWTCDLELTDLEQVAVKAGRAWIGLTIQPDRPVLFWPPQPVRRIRPRFLSFGQPEGSSAKSLERAARPVGQEAIF